MGLLSIIAEALGLARPRPALTPLALTDAGRSRLAQLPDGHVVVIRTTPNERGWLVSATEKLPTQPIADSPLPSVQISAEDHARLTGWLLHYDGERWQPTVHIDVRGFATPNPNSRRYALSRPLSDQPLYFPKAPEPPPPVDRLLSRDDIVAVLINGPSLVVERTHDSPWPPIDQEVAAAVREHFLLAGSVLTEAHLPSRDDPFEEQVYQVLRDRVLPGIHRDGGDLHLLGIKDGVVRVHLVGACRTCPSAAFTLRSGVEQVLKAAFPGRIHRVEQA
jgi:Fe-S cluster biogenesis protein NfuA